MFTFLEVGRANLRSCHVARVSASSGSGARGRSGTLGDARGRTGHYHTALVALTLAINTHTHAHSSQLTPRRAALALLRRRAAGDFLDLPLFTGSSCS